MTRVVADPNVLVSAIIADGEPRDLLRRGIRGEIDLLHSTAILEEVVDVLGRPKFKAARAEIYRIALDAVCWVGRPRRECSMFNISRSLGLNHAR